VVPLMFWLPLNPFTSLFHSKSYTKSLVAEVWNTMGEGQSKGIPHTYYLPQPWIIRTNFVCNRIMIQRREASLLHIWYTNAAVEAFVMVVGIGH